MRGSSGPLAIACLTIMYCCSGSAALFSTGLGALFAGFQLLLILGFAINCMCSYLLLRDFGRRGS
jgi:hypothetical protein